MKKLSERFSYQNFLKNKSILKKWLATPEIKSEIFCGALVGYCLTTIIYNYSMLLFAWKKNIIIPEATFQSIILSQLTPLVFIGVISCRVLSYNNLPKVCSKTIDIIIYAGLCFYSGYLYSKLNLKVSLIQEYFGLSYVFSLFLVNVLLSITKELNIKYLKPVFFLKLDQTKFSFK